MPNLTGQAATFQAGQYTYRGYISTPPQDIILAGTLSATPTYPTLTLAYTVDSGSEGDVAEDMTVVLFESDGTTIKGVLRVANGGAASNVLQIHEFSAGAADMASGDKFEVRDTFLVWDKLVAANDEFDKDSRITYSDQGSALPPFANSGGPRVGFVSGSTIIHSFDNTNSAAVDPDNVSGLTYANAIDDGSYVTGGATSGSYTASFPEGFRHVTVTVTDADNSKTALKYIPTWAHTRSGTNAPLSVVAAGLSGSINDGTYNMTIVLPIAAEADLAVLPDGAMITYWEEEFYGGVEVSYGSEVSEQAHVKFVGYLIRDSISIDAEANEVTFEAVGPVGMLALTPALPQLLVREASPDEWKEVAGVTSNIVLWYILWWHSSFGTIHDVELSSEINLAVQRLAVTDVSSLLGQLQDVAGSFNIRVANDRLGRLLFRKHPGFLTSAERAARTTAYNFTTADFISADIDTEHRGTVKLLRGDGITVDDAAVFSVAPGQAPAPLGTGVSSLSRQILSDQADLNTRTGLAFAKENSQHDGQFVPRGVTLELADGYDVFDFALGDWLTLTLAASTNGRGRAYTTATRWFIEGVNIDYDHEAGSKGITLTISHETDGADGITAAPPLSGLPTFDDPGDDWGGIDFPPESGGGLLDLNAAVGNLAVFTQDGGLYTCDWTLAVPVWVQQAIGGSAPTSGTGAAWWYSMAVDAYSPLYLGSGTTVDMKCMSNRRIFGIVDVFGASGGPTGTIEETFTEFFETERIATERGFQDWWVAAAWHHGASDPNDGAYIYETTDGGTTWSATQLSAATRSLSTSTNRQAVYASRNVLGKIYTLVMNTSVTGEFAIRWRPTQTGSWAWKFSPNTLYALLPMGGWFEFPVDNNTDEEFFYWGGKDNATGLSILWRYDHGTVTDITLDIGGVKYGPRARRGISSFAGDRNRLVMIATAGSSHSDENWVLATSTDGGNNWTVKQGPTTAAIELPFDGCYLAGDNGNIIYLIGSTTSPNTPQIAVSYDFGSTIQDKSSNLAALGAERVIGIMGG